MTAINWPNHYGDRQSILCYCSQLSTIGFAYGRRLFNLLLGWNQATAFAQQHLRHFFYGFALNETIVSLTSTRTLKSPASLTHTVESDAMLPFNPLITPH